ncbi:SAUR-like auxin-responsive protein family [Hirschfeldia incana]|nr:SAUR-like auxin-responsive protein family [Hirschfeldia incana]
MMMRKRIASFKNLAKRVNSINTKEEGSESPLIGEADDTSSTAVAAAAKTPTGSCAVYVGEGRVRCVVPTSYLNHPLFRMLLDKSHDELHCFGHKVMLVVPCSLSVFQDVVNAIESCNGSFDFGDCVEEFL